MICLICDVMQVSKVTKSDGSHVVSLVPTSPEGTPRDIPEVSCLLWAVGRDANMVGLNIESAGVKLNQKGFVDVDEYQNTSVKNVYALGDIAGNKLLTPGTYDIHV